jgi:hypothetical protein
MEILSVMIRIARVTLKKNSELGAVETNT